LISKKTGEGEDDTGESALKYLNTIKDICKNDPVLFEKIKRLPQKARSSKQNDEKTDSLITYFI